MPSANDLNAEGQIYEAEFKRAWALLRERKAEEANGLARHLLMEPSLGKLHRAGLHLLLAHGPDGYLKHAQEAVRLYENLYPDPLGRTRRQKESQETLLKSARQVLEQAEKYADEYCLPPTDAEIEEDLQALKDDEEPESEMRDTAVSAAGQELGPDTAMDVDGKEYQEQNENIEEGEGEEDEEDEFHLPSPPPTSDDHHEM
ncbi:hypothetical protein PRZ48_006416 [Zasmidium cellare]|uniref:Uncharacterized protein n=1 Tax=Zasmidium cellare TaxID=395010 RepID=A0ABR0EN27_ZASCE|nr:hypothetical protein PRZ48_006416 [Zasmidium cellare]